MTTSLKLEPPFYDAEVVRQVFAGIAWLSQADTAEFRPEDETFWIDLTKALRLSLEKQLNSQNDSAGS